MTDHLDFLAFQGRWVQEVFLVPGALLVWLVLLEFLELKGVWDQRETKGPWVLQGRQECQAIRAQLGHLDL